MKSWIPATYAELLGRIDPAAFSALMRRLPGGINADIFDGYQSNENLIKRFVDHVTSVSFLKGLRDSLSQYELKALRAAIREGGFLGETHKRYPEKSTIDGLKAKGLAFRFDGAERSGVVVPLEICLGLPFDKEEMPGSLLLAMNRYSSDVIKMMASRVGIYQYTKYQKTRLSAIVYTRHIEKLSSNVGVLTDIQKRAIRTIFQHGGVISNDKLNEWGRHEKLKEPEGVKNWYDHKDLLHFITNGWGRSEKDLSQLDQEMLTPVLFGLVCISYLERYDTHWRYFIPLEAHHVLAADFFREMDAKRDAAEKTMVTYAPGSFVSYAGRIEDDIIKVQVAAVCGLVVQVKYKPEFKRKSVSRLAELLGVEEGYTERLLRLASSQAGWAKNADGNGFTLIREAVLKQEYAATMFPLLKSFTDWVLVVQLVDYLRHHRALYKFAAWTSSGDIEELLRDAGLLGLLDFSTDGKKTRSTPFLSRALEGHGQDVPIPMKREGKPLIVQPNLELLIPLHTESKLLRKLSEFTDLTVLDRMLHFALAKQSLLRGLDHDWDAPGVLRFLSSLCPKEIPGTVRNFIESSFGKRGEAVVLPCSALVHCTGLGLKGRILSLKGVKAHEVEGALDYLVIEDANPDEVLRMLKKNGIFAEMPPEQGMKETAKKKGRTKNEP